MVSVHVIFVGCFYFYSSFKYICYMHNHYYGNTLLVIMRSVAIECCHEHIIIGKNLATL